MSVVLQRLVCAGQFVAGDGAEFVDVRPGEVVQRSAGGCEVARPIVHSSSEDFRSE